MTVIIIYVAQGISVSANNIEQDFPECRIVRYYLIYTHVKGTSALHMLCFPLFSILPFAFS